jgi:poly(A) polymerase
MLRRLRLPRRERRRITRLIELHLRPSLLAEAGAPARGLRRLVRDAGEDLPLLVLHAACDALASGSPDAARRFRKLRAVLVRLLELQREAEREPLPRLLDGHELMAALAIEPGPLVGRLLRRLEEAQQEGRVRTREQALAFLQDQASR